MIDAESQSVPCGATEVGNSKTEPEQRPHQHSQIPPRERNEIALLHIFDPAQPCSSRPARVAHVSEAPLDALRSQSLKAAASLTANAPAVGAEGVSPSRGLVDPTPRSSFGSLG